MSDDPCCSDGFRRFAVVVLGFAVLLIWWGAATTTKGAGMAFADWPLSLGSINPPGWLEYAVPFLEHSHRLLATWVGLLVLAMFTWAYAKSPRRAVEVGLLVLVLAVVFGVFVAAGAERAEPSRKRQLLALGVGAAIVPLGWLGWSWWGRGWNRVEKLCALALLLVTAQAILGGLRVTEISNAFAAVHGCVAQAFFCLLLLIVMAAGRGWRRGGFVATGSRLRYLRMGGSVLLGLVFIQLIIGASMRHFHRYGLADRGLLMTQGEWIPPFDEPIIAVMFLHKVMACILLVVAGGMWLGLRRGSGEEWDGKRPLRYAAAIAGLLLVQVALGLAVIATGKQFWITNFHVLNGLAILATAFVWCVEAWRGRSPEPALANS